MTATTHDEPAGSAGITPQETVGNEFDVVPVIDVAEFWRAIEAKGWHTLAQAAFNIGIEKSWLSKMLNRRTKLAGAAMVKMHFALRDVTTFERLIKYEVSAVVAN